MVEDVDTSTALHRIPFLPLPPLKAPSSPQGYQIHHPTTLLLQIPRAYYTILFF